MPKVYSRRRGAETPPNGAVYVGRPTSVRQSIHGCIHPLAVELDAFVLRAIPYADPLTDMCPKNTGTKRPMAARAALLRFGREPHDPPNLKWCN